MAFDRMTYSTRGILAVALSLLAQPAFAQALPSPMEQDVLVRNSLLTFNDANVTGNYSVLHDKGSKPFRDALPAEKLKDSFKEFSEKHINFDTVAVKPITPSEPGKIDDEGQLVLAGTVVISDDQKITYKFEYIRSEGEWKLIGLNVKQ